MALSFTTLGCVVVVAWLFTQARRGGFDKAVQEELRNDLERTKATLDILSGPLPSPRRSLDILSDTDGRGNGAMPEDERDHKWHVDPHKVGSLPAKRDCVSGEPELGLVHE